MGTSNISSLLVFSVGKFLSKFVHSNLHLFLVAEILTILFNFMFSPVVYNMGKEINTAMISLTKDIPKRQALGQPGR
jgi:hypothetical protein